jgi:hypothetical protein
VFKINVLAATIKDCYQALTVAARGGGGKAAVADLMGNVAVFILSSDQLDHTRFRSTHLPLILLMLRWPRLRGPRSTPSQLVGAKPLPSLSIVGLDPTTQIDSFI